MYKKGFFMCIHFLPGLGDVLVNTKLECSSLPVG